MMLIAILQPTKYAIHCFNWFSLNSDTSAASRYKNFGVLPKDDVVNVETCRSEVRIS
jgi:hypothetical protein